MGFTILNAEGSERVMLRWALIFFIVAIISGLLGFTTIAGAAMEIATIIFYIFLILFIISLFIGLFSGRRVRQ